MVTGARNEYVYNIIPQSITKLEHTYRQIYNSIYKYYSSQDLRFRDIGRVRVRDNVRLGYRMGVEFGLG